MPQAENNHIVESPTEARAGTTGHGVRYVLGFGTVAALFVVVYLYFFA